MSVNIKKIIQREMMIEAVAIKQASKRIDKNIVEAVNYISDCQGKLVTTGMGKSGLIARKIAATFASTGTMAIYLHPAEGIHGDLGMLQKGDVVLALSHSGNTQELVSVISYIKFNEIPVIAVTGNVDSVLAKNADVVIDASIDKDVEPFGLVPTASTAVQLSIGDALAVAVLNKKGFEVHDFAKIHPGGTIGKKLLYNIADLMHTGNAMPMTKETANVKKAIAEMSEKGLGCTLIVNRSKKLVGIVTDGDLRRFLSQGFNDLEVPVENAMTRDPKRMKSNELAVEALNLMEKYKITMLPVVNDKDEPVGLLHMHDLIRAGVI